MELSTKTAEGKFKKIVTITTNDPETPSVKLGILANITETLSLEPRVINFGMIKKGSENKNMFKITNNYTNPVTIKEISAKPEGVARILQKDRFVLAPGESKEIVLSLTPGDSNNSIYGKAIIKTDVENLPEKLVRFQAHIIKEQN